MKKKKVDKILKGVVTAGVALGGASFMTDADMVYAAELDEESDATAESQLEQGESTTESESESVVEDIDESTNEQDNTEGALESDEASGSDNASQSEEGSSSESESDQDGIQESNNDGSGSEESSNSEEALGDEVTSENTLEGDALSGNIDGSELENGPEFIELKTMRLVGGGMKAMMAGFEAPQTDTQNDEDSLSASTSASESQSTSTFIEESELAEDKQNELAASIYNNQTIKDEYNANYNNIKGLIFNCSNWNQMKAVAKTWITNALVLDGATDIDFVNKQETVKPYIPGTGNKEKDYRDFYFIVKYKDKDGAEHTEYYDTSQVNQFGEFNNSDNPKDYKDDETGVVYTNNTMVVLKKNPALDENGNVKRDGKYIYFEPENPGESDLSGGNKKGSVIFQFEKKEYTKSEFKDTLDSLSKSASTAESESLRGSSITSRSESRSESQSVSEELSESTSISLKEESDSASTVASESDSASTAASEEASTAASTEASTAASAEASTEASTAASTAASTEASTQASTEASTQASTEAST
ncbi:MAG: hypothetical protein J5525_04135, partial [Lachnospiraceae bacterium]|nr:hypothetical protein [Lachnospiraceae bacterium]